MQYKIIDHDGSQSLAVFASGELHTISSGSHPLFRTVVDGIRDGSLSEEQVVNMVRSVGTIVAQATEGLSERVSFDAARRVLRFDGEVVDTTLSRHIVRILREQGTGAAAPWVRFMEKLAENPSRLSRIHLYAWLETAGEFTITQSGDILGYKSVGADRLSHTAGAEEVRVNGAVHVGRIPNPDGALVEMNRELVDTDRDEACSVGLHIGNYDYANRFGGYGSILLLVAVSPADVVSVPRDCSSQKMRACRYEVLTEAARRERISVSVWSPESETDDDEDDERCSTCGSLWCETCLCDEPECSCTCGPRSDDDEA